MTKKAFLFILIVALAAFLRFYMLGSIPAGIHADEESHGYNAFSIIQTGKDRYGQSFPILFRSFGSYQPPVLTYLTIIPVYFLGNTVFAARFWDGLFGVILVGATYFVSTILIKEKRLKASYALISSLVIALSPWAIFYSRLTAEGTLGVGIFAISILCLLLSINKVKYFPLATFFLALSTHAYYSERVIAVVFLPLFLLLYRKNFKKNVRVVIAGLLVFVVIMLPHLAILTTGALTKRLDQVGSLGTFNFFDFIKRYLMYYSPRNLFFDTGKGLGRISPEMGVYYTVFLPLFFVGLVNFKKLIDRSYHRFFVLLILITPVSAALTSDGFYPLRALDLIWLYGFVISVGLLVFLMKLTKYWIKVALVFVLSASCIFSFYVSYFVLFKYELSRSYGNEYMLLLKKLDEYKGRSILIDSTRDPGVGLRYAYLTKYDPVDLQKQLSSQMTPSYYSGEVKRNEVYSLGNILVRPFSWNDACLRDTIIIGDPATFSQEQAKEHNLKFEFEIWRIDVEKSLVAYSTNPTKEQCSN